MKSYTNNAPGPRGINLVDGSTRWIEPGETVEIDPKTIAEGPLPDMSAGDFPAAATDEIENLRARNAELEAEVAELQGKLAAFDPDGNGQPGGGAKQEPAALSGKNKSELLEIAKAEGVTVADDATNEQIRTAIEDKRASA